MFYFDPLYMLIFFASIIISAGAQMYISRSYGKWSKVANGSGKTGLQVGQELLVDTNLSVEYQSTFGQNVQFQGIGGNLSDHYDPRAHTVRLSQGVATQPSVASMAIVAHELGHAEQHAQKSTLIRMRNFLVPAVRVSPMISYGLILVGLIFNFTGLFNLGIIFFAVSVLFSVITLPVELDASKRAMKLLDEAGLFVTPQDRQGSRAVLNAAASTYLAAMLTSVLQLFYYISLAQRRS